MKKIYRIFWLDPTSHSGTLKTPYKEHATVSTCVGEVRKDGDWWAVISYTNKSDEEKDFLILHKSLITKMEAL